MAIWDFHGPLGLMQWLWKDIFSFLYIANCYRNRNFSKKSFTDGPNSATKRFYAKAGIPVDEDLDVHSPRVTIIRPVKGLEPYLYECLASTFNQDYKQKDINFCISSYDDPALPTLQRLVSDFESFEPKIYVEEDDRKSQTLGPNPKIRNMSRAYRDTARNGSDIVWIVDCNVWVSPSTCTRMVDLLCGTGHGPFPMPRAHKYKFVHQLPLVVDVSDRSFFSKTAPAHTPKTSKSLFSKLCEFVLGYPLGGLLEELFLSSSHAKFYTAISAVAVAPCTVGKSNMFRWNHLYKLTGGDFRTTHKYGINFFSHNICEDHLIGDLLWKSPVPTGVANRAKHEDSTFRTSRFLGVIHYDKIDARSLPLRRWEDLDDAEKERRKGPHYVVETECKWSNHALLANPPCIQPLANVPLSSYLARRIRWLRVRKFTVLLATLVEPGTESLLCSLYGAFGLTTFPWCNTALHVPHTWTAFALIWALSVTCWMAVDFTVWRILQGWKGEVGNRRMKEFFNYGNSKGLPPFVGSSGKNRGFGQFLLGWVGREVLALPIWVLAVLGGATVVWRGRTYKVGMDARVQEVGVEKKDE
ncbi:hypothetical protein MMC14_002982 [Varicellaria rhodocarpa]|nr:hypothetical protein [Varicellaria rhodocarpa]